MLASRWFLSWGPERSWATRCSRWAAAPAARLLQPSRAVPQPAVLARLPASARRPPPPPSSPSPQAFDGALRGLAVGEGAVLEVRRGATACGLACASGGADAPSPARCAMHASPWLAAGDAPASLQCSHVHTPAPSFQGTHTTFMAGGLPAPAAGNTRVSPVLLAPARPREASGSGSCCSRCRETTQRCCVWRGATRGAAGGGGSAWRGATGGARKGRGCWAGSRGGEAGR